MKIKLYALVYIAGWLAVAFSCNKKNDYTNTVEVTREWSFTASSSNENYVIAGGEINAAVHLVASADNSIRYDIKVDSSVADKIVSAQINLGDPVTDGAQILSLTLRIYGTYASGVLTGLRQGLIDTLINNNIDKYINVTSDKAPAGLVRGQLNQDLLLSKNVRLTGSSVVPSVTTTATGTVFLRLAANNMLYSKVVVNNDPADPAATATINQGPAGVNGAVMVTLASSAAEFGIAKKSAANASLSSALLNNSTYVNVSSAASPNGKLRGQIK